jgi:hypothetical protein
LTYIEDGSVMSIMRRMKTIAAAAIALSALAVAHAEDYVLATYSIGPARIDLKATHAKCTQPGEMDADVWMDGKLDLESACWKRLDSERIEVTVFRFLSPAARDEDTRLILTRRDLVRSGQRRHST